MANDKQLDPGFEEVSLSPGFEEVSLSEPEAKPAPEEDMTLSEAARMGAKGATFGFSDELLGGLQAVGDVASSEKSLSDLPTLYRAYQKAEEAKQKDISERHPLKSMGLELGAGMLTGGALASLGKKAAAAAAPSLLSKLSALSGAQKAAALGGAQAAGLSEHSLDDPGKLARDIATGGALGYGVGKTIDIAKGIGSKLGQSDIGQKTAQAYESSKARGLGYLAPETEQQVQSQLVGTAEQAAESLMAPRAAAAERLNDVAKSIPEIETGNLAQQAKSILASAKQIIRGENPDYRKVESVFAKYYPKLKNKVQETINEVPTDVLDNMGNPLTKKVSSISKTPTMISGEDLHKFKTDMNGLLGQLTDPDARQVVKNIVNLAEQEFEKHGPYKEASNYFKYISSLIPEQATAPSTLRGGTKWVGDYRGGPAAAQADIAKRLGGIAESAASPAASPAARQARSTLSTLERNIGQEEASRAATLGGGLPSLLGEMGTPSASAIPESLLKAGREADILKTVKSGSLLNISDLGKLTRKSAYLTASQLGVLANKYQNSGMSKAADIVQKAIANPGTKNAALLQLLQNPLTRSVAEEELGTSDKE